MKTLLAFFGILICLNSWSQIGGQNSFAFMDLPYSARAAGLGGQYISAKDQDLNLGILNPSLLNSEMLKSINLNSSIHTGGINHGMLNYAFGFKNEAVLSTYIKYVNWGKIEQTDETGASEGSFNPFEMVAGAGYGRQINPRISVGGNFNFIFSQLAGYSSYGASIDLAGTYHNPESSFLVTALAKNVGVQFNSYAGNGNRAPLPIDFQLATSYKLKHAPFRFSLLIHDLNKWDLSYNDPTAQPTIDPLSGDTIPVPRATVVEKFFRHLTFQLEAPLTKNFHLRAGYDFNRRKELGLEQRPGASGFSFGTGLYFRRFSIDYGFIIYSSAGFNNVFKITLNLDQIRKAS